MLQEAIANGRERLIMFSFSLSLSIVIELKFITKIGRSDYELNGKKPHITKMILKNKSNKSFPI
jgi:hypothetical protein